MNRWLGGVLVCWLLHAVHGEPLPVCFTKPQHQQHFNGRWLPLKPTETVRLSPVRVCGCRWVLTVVAWAGTVHSSTNRAATRTGCCSIGSRPEGGQGGTATTQGLHRLRGGLGGGRALPRACACHLSSHTDSGPSFILSYRQRSFIYPLIPTAVLRIALLTRGAGGVPDVGQVPPLRATLSTAKCHRMRAAV
jgi:hypothetical protein